MTTEHSDAAMVEQKAVKKVVQWVDQLVDELVECLVVPWVEY